MSFLNRFLPGRPQDDILASVIRNLEHLLNSRRDYGSLLCSFGLADYLAEQGGSQASGTLLREIQQTIDLYEPRLRVLSLKTTGRDCELWMHIDLQGLLLRPFQTEPCQLLLLFHPLSGAIEIPRPRPSALRASTSPPAVAPQLPPDLSAVHRAAEIGPEALLASHPEIATVLVVAALAARAGLLPALLSGPAARAGRAALESNNELALHLALVGQAARARLLPPPLAGPAALAAKLASDYNSEVAEAAAIASVSAQTGKLPPGLAAPLLPSGQGAAATEMILLAGLAAQSGLLPQAVAAAVAQSPRLALTTTPELAGAIAVASLVAQLGVVVPQALPVEARRGW